MYCLVEVNLGLFWLEIYRDVFVGMHLVLFGWCVLCCLVGVHLVFGLGCIMCLWLGVHIALFGWSASWSAFSVIWLKFILCYFAGV